MHRYATYLTFAVLGNLFSKAPQALLIANCHEVLFVSLKCNFHRVLHLAEQRSLQWVLVKRKEEWRRSRATQELFLQGKRVPKYGTFGEGPQISTNQKLENMSAFYDTLDTVV